MEDSARRPRLTRAISYPLSSIPVAALCNPGTLAISTSGVQARSKNVQAPRPENRVLIRLFQALDVCYARIYHRLHVHAPCRLPRDGAAILVCNHTSGLDPLLIQSVCPRLIVWMVAQEYVELPVLRWLFRTIEAIPVGRDGRDLSATRQALRALESGRILGVFPEGRIEPGRELLPFETGVALLAIKTRLPVYPVFLDGTQRGQTMAQSLLRRQNASICFGRPLRLHEDFSSKDLIGATFALQSVVESLGKEPYRTPTVGPLTQRF